MDIYIYMAMIIIMSPGPDSACSNGHGSIITFSTIPRFATSSVNNITFAVFFYDNNSSTFTSVWKL